MKKIVVLAMTVIMSLSVFVGCGGSPKIDIDDIEYTITEGIVDGNRMPVFSYTNNSDYDIISLNIDYKIKDGVSSDELNSISEIKEKAESKSHDISETKINVFNDRYVPAGDKCENVPIYLDNTYSYVTDMSTTDLMTPDILKVMYVKNGTIYSAYYDYKNEKMTYNEDTRAAKSWSETDLAKSIPEPDSNVVIVDSDDDGYFRAIACHYTKDDYDKYVKKCKEAGYTKEQDSYESTKYCRYTAKNDKGYEVEVYFTEEKNLDVAVDKD